MGRCDVDTLIGRRLVAAGFCLALFAVGGAWAQTDEPTRESLLAAWETAQREDPQTIVFEKEENGRYRFATNRFPFDGTVRVLNLVVDDSGVKYPSATVMGVVEAELEDMSDDFRRQHAYSVGLWQAANMLYFDYEHGRWMTSAEWQGFMVDQYASPNFMSWISSSFWLIFLLIIVIVLWWTMRRAGRQFKSATAAQDKALAEQERAIRLTEEAIEIGRDSNRLLRGILEALTGPDPPSEE